LAGALFVSAILDSEGLDPSFFAITDPDTLAAVAEARVQEVVAQLQADLAADPIAHAARIHVGLYFLRAAAYVDFYSTAVDYSASLRSEVTGLLIAVGQHPQFLDPAFLDARAEWAVVSDSWFAMSAQVDRITFLLRRYLDTPALQNASTPENRTEGSMMYALLYGMARTANQDPNWAGHYTVDLMQALADLSLTLPDTEDIEYIILNAIYMLGRLRAGEAVAAYQGQAHQILTSVLADRDVDSPPYLEALMALELEPYGSRLADGTAFDVAAYREQLKARVFSNTYTYDGGSLVFCTPLDARTVRDLYDAVRECKAQFFRVTQALRPIDDDSNAALTLRIYGSMQDYHDYQRFLYSLGTDNGGMYIENWATFFTYQRTSEESIYTLEELTRHEYIHYLDAYFLLVPSFGDSPWYDNDHLTWHAEGLAEFLAGSRRTHGVPVRRNQLNGALSSGAPMTIAEIIGATYASGFGFYPNAAMFFQFLHEEHPELHWAYFRALHADDMAAFDALAQGWRADGALQEEYDSYLPRVSGELEDGTRLAAEDLPTGYKPEVLYGVTLAHIQSDIESVLPAGTIAAAEGRFHFSATMNITIPDADESTPEQFQAEFGRQLDQALVALTPIDAHYQCATAWFEQLGVEGHTASATLHLESWFNANTAPMAVADAEHLDFDPLYSDDTSAQTLILHVVNTSPHPLIIQSITLAGPDADLFDIWWGGVTNPELAGRGTLAIQVTTQPDNLAGRAPNTYTATLTLLTANGDPALVHVPLSVSMAAPLFVDPQAPPGGDGSSWDRAFPTISAAIVAAPTGNEALFIAAGTYAESVTLRDSLHLYGGFSGFNGARESRASERQPEVHEVLIHTAVAPVVNFTGTANALVDGVTISGGQASGADGGGVLIAQVSGEAVLRHCDIRYNRTDGSGGGVYIRDSAARLEDCALLGNSARYGGGVAVSGRASEVTLARCWIAGNDGGTTDQAGAGGGLYLSGGRTEVEDGRILGNTADQAAGFHVVNDGSTLKLEGTLIAANVSRGWFGGGANYSRSTLQADHCVFFRNRSGPGYGFAGLGTLYGATSTVRNSLFVGHSDAEATGLGWGEDLGVLQAHHCLFHDNTLDFSDGTHTASGAAQLNALSGVFTNAFAADPGWLVPPSLAGTVIDATYNDSARTTLLTLTGASLTPGSLRGLVLSKGATAAVAVLAHTGNTITVFGRHDTLAQWDDWQPQDFHLTSGSPCVDTGMATGSVTDPDGFPRGVDLADAPNGSGVGFDLGLYEYKGIFATQPLLRIDMDNGSVSLFWPMGMPGWRISSSTDLRHWTPVADTPGSVEGWQYLLRSEPNDRAFFRLQNP